MWETIKDWAKLFLVLGFIAFLIGMSLISIGVDILKFKVLWDFIFN